MTKRLDAINNDESLFKNDIIQQSQQLRISSSKSQRSIQRLTSASSLNKIKTDEQSLILNLPTEIICLIMSFLNLNDRKNASLISKRWRNSFEDGYMLKDIVVKGNNNLLQQKEQHIHDKSFYEKAVNIEFKNDIKLDLFQDEKLAREIDLSHLKCLILNNCTNLNTKVFYNVLKSAPNIEKLCLIQCDTLFMNGFLATQANMKLLKLEYLSELSLSKNRYLNDQVFSLFLDIMPNLKKLDLSYCFLTKTQFTSIKTSETASSAAVPLSSAMFTFENMCRLIEKHGERIKSLNLTGMELLNKEENILKLLVNIDSLSLDELVMENLSSLKIRTICKILNKQNKLRSLNLNNSMQSQDDYNSNVSSAVNGFELMLTEMFDNKNGAHLLCDSIAELRLKKMFLNSNCYILCDISKLQNLNFLDLSYCTFNLSFQNKKQLNLYIKQMANNFNQLKQLETLILSYCDFFVNDYVIQKISLSLNKLKHLDIRNCGNITNKSLHFISKYLANLEHLDVSWCRKITDHGLNKNLIEILLKYETSFDKHTSFGFCKCSICIKMLTNGIHTNIQETSGYNDEDFREGELDDIVIENEISLKNLKKLKTLRLESCVNISDIGLSDGINVSQLHELDIKLCTNITGMFLCKNENLNLKTLYLNQCINFTNENLLQLLRFSRNLKQLFASACPAITNQTLEYLRANKIILNALDVSYCSNVNEHYMDLYEQFLYNEFCSRDFFIDKRFISKSIE